MPDVTIRRMTLADAEAVHAIEVATFAQPWSLQSFRDEMERNKCARYLVAERDGRVIGYAGIWCILDEGHVTNVAIAPGERGRGLGTRLTSALLQYAANLGVRCATLEVRPSNEAALKLYKRLGFKRYSVRKGYYEDNGEDALLMVCPDMPEADPDFEE